MFVLVFLPFFLTSVSLGADYSRALLVKRQAASTAEAMAMAGATAFSPTQEGTLMPDLAAARANQMYSTALSTGMAPSSVTVSALSATTRRVDVTVTAKVELTLASAIVRLFAPSSQGLSITATTSRRAVVCDPTLDVSGDYYADGLAIAGCSYVVEGDF